MGSELRLLFVMCVVLALLGGSGAAWAYFSPSGKCHRIGGQWNAQYALCLCNGEPVPL